MQIRLKYRALDIIFSQTTTIVQILMGVLFRFKMFKSLAKLFSMT